MRTRAQRTSKYNAHKVEIDGHIFDSEKEGGRYLKLKADQHDGIISDLRIQVPFELIPKQALIKPYMDGNGRMVNSMQAITYKADFVYRLANGEYVVEDVKPTDKSGNIPKKHKATPAWKEYIIKKKLMLYKFGIQVIEV